MRLGGRIGRALALALVVAGTVARADTDLPTKFSNQGSVANTRHNLSQRQNSGGGPTGALMDPYRNDYMEVCVYCHTPHAANTGVALPLWNRTLRATSYTTYDMLGTSTLTEPVTQPGPNSLACLSCHDGQTAVDSVINMPTRPNQVALLAAYPGGYLASQATTQNNTFLNAWNNERGPDASVHLGLNPTEALGCLACHSSNAGLVGAGAADFRAGVIGTDLRNDHPVGVRYPVTFGPAVDFNPTTATKPSMRWFDGNGNGRPDTREVRLYDSGDGYEVECASCHDPHGVPAGAAGSTFLPTFLRVANTGSALCLTCHIK